jgi:bacillithiol system protein YtxJ
MKKIESLEQFNAIYEENDVFMLLKHSSTCPVSQAGYEEFENFVEDHSHIPTYYLIVQEARPLSNHIAETFHVKHESPQVILFKNKDVTWHASHWKITYDALSKETTTN